MIFKSPHPDVTVPDVSVPAFVMQHAARLADKPAIIDAASGTTLTYAQLEPGEKPNDTLVILEDTAGDESPTPARSSPVCTTRSASSSGMAGSS